MWTGTATEANTSSGSFALFSYHCHLPRPAVDAHRPLLCITRSQTPALGLSAATPPEVAMAYAINMRRASRSSHLSVGLSICKQVESYMVVH